MLKRLFNKKKKIVTQDESESVIQSQAEVDYFQSFESITDVSENLSKMIAIPKPHVSFELELILQNLNNSDYIQSADFKNELGMIEVITSSGAAILLSAHQTYPQLADELAACNKIPDGNLFVTAADIAVLDQIEAYLYSEMTFGLDTPEEDYYAQFKVLSLAIEAQFFYDISARKIISYEYLEFMESVDKKSLYKNMFTVIPYSDWIYTYGLKRFHLPEIEMIHDLTSEKLLNFMINHGVMMLEKGRNTEQQVINYHNQMKYMAVPIEIALQKFPESFIKSEEYRGHEFVSNTQVLLLFESNSSIDLNNLLSTVNCRAVENSDRYFSVQTLDTRDNVLARTTFELVKKALSGKYETMEALKIKFILRCGEQEEYIYGRVSGDICATNFEVELLNKPFFTSDQKGDLISITSEDIIFWELPLHMAIKPENAFALLKPEIKSYLQNLE